MKPGTVTGPAHAHAHAANPNPAFARRQAQKRVSTRTGRKKAAGATATEPTPPPPAPQKETTRKECLSCVGEYDSSEGHALNCGHFFCKPCIVWNVESACSSDPFRPAQCCEAIPHETIQQFTTEDLARRHQDKMEEFETREKLYCHNTACKAFIPIRNRTARIGRCDKCGKNTCKSCKAKSHWGVCPSALLEGVRGLSGEEQWEKTLEVARAKGWLRCPLCLTVIQKSGGCDHMYCISCQGHFSWSEGKPI